MGDWRESSAFERGCRCGATSVGSSGPMSALAKSFEAIGGANAVGGWIPDGPGQAIDLSRTAFRVGGGTRVADLLYALPYVKATPVLGSLGSTTTDLRAEVARAADGIPGIVSYDLESAAVSDTSRKLSPAQTFPLERLGGRARVLTIDQIVTPGGTAQSYASYNVQVAAVAVLAALDKALAQEANTGGSAGLKGLSQLGIENGATRVAASSKDIERDASLALTSISCTDGAAGAGPDCLIAGRRVLRKLMASTSGRSGTSGWGRDVRSGRRVYHYLGLPVYRADIDETHTTRMGRLWAANLGPTGLNLLHVHGTRSSFGLELQETPVTTATGAREITVHGAWGLMLWEPEALYEVNAIDVSDLP